MKLSPKQKEVIKLMRTGKDLYFSYGIDASAGFDGGAKIEISTATFFSLEKKGLLKKVERKNISLLTYYTLSELGKTIEL